MTTKEQLHQLVDELEPAQAENLLRLAVDVYDLPRQRRPRPEFIGMGASGRGDLARRAEEILAEGLGRRE